MTDTINFEAFVSYLVPADTLTLKKVDALRVAWDKLSGTLQLESNLVGRFYHLYWEHLRDAPYEMHDIVGNN